MSGNRIALDTNAAIDVLNNAADVHAWLAGVVEIKLPVPVVGELHFGALNSKRAAQNLTRIETLIARSDLLDVDVTTARIYADLRLKLKQAGKPIPENVIWIAALCIQHELPLATSDGHFAVVQGLEVVSGK